jgi:hypothetical protein
LAGAQGEEDAEVAAEHGEVDEDERPDPGLAGDPLARVVLRRFRGGSVVGLRVGGLM